MNFTAEPAAVLPPGPTRRGPSAAGGHGWIGPWILGAALSLTGLVLGGAIGIGLDRWRLGYVIDFLALVPISFPVFNLADVAINLAVLCFAIDLMGSHGQHRP